MGSICHNVLLLNCSKKFLINLVLALIVFMIFIQGYAILLIFLYPVHLNAMKA